MPARTYARLDCPRCSAALARLRRQPTEKSAHDKSDMRRYRCVAEGCAWEGLLPRRVRAPRRLWRRTVSHAVRRVALPLVAGAGLLVTLGAIAWQAGLLAGPAQRGYAPGEHHEGEKLPQAHPLSRHHDRAERVAQALVVPTAASSGAPRNEAPVAGAAGGPDTLQLRYGCVWGQPGRHPYQGSVEQALRSAALPEEVVQSIAAQVRAKAPVDRLEIRNDGVHALASGRVFNAQNIALTYGRTLCLGSRVNFKAGHVEPAALYEASTRSGAVIAVMVPEVCGNVSVLGQSDDSVRLMRLSATGGDADISAARWMPAVLDGATGVAVAASSNDIPVPGTLACVLAALAAWRGLRWLRPADKA